MNTGRRRGPTGMAHAFTQQGLDDLDAAMAHHVAAGHPPGAVWAVARGDELHVATAGNADAGGTRPVRRDTIFRISSMSKPVAAAAALVLVDAGRLGLDDPVDGPLPELAERRVLADPDGPLDDTVPAQRPITVRDLLTFRLGCGMDFARLGRQRVMGAMADLGLGAGPPAPGRGPGSDEWLRRLATLPLEYQPGQRWLYHIGADVLGILVARVVGRPLEDVVADLVLGPLGMRDTAFTVAPGDLDRFTDCVATDPVTGEPGLYDRVEGQWSRPPVFASAGAGLVSTVDDYLAFARMLRDGGHPLLSAATVRQMTTDQLTAAQRASSSPAPDGSVGWGLGLGVRAVRTESAAVGTYGWNGGLGSVWATDPAVDLTGVLLTNEAWASPAPPAIVDDFWRCAYAALR